MDTDGKGTIQRQQLFNQLKKTVNPDLYEYEMELQQIDDLCRRTSSTSGGIVSEEINVFETEEIDTSVWQQIDELWLEH